MTLFDTVLVANRGEIAVRVIRTLRKLGMRAATVFTAADAGARHIQEADTAVRVESYLSIGEQLRAAARTGARAVHPGYGFLAENPAFARACTESGLVFIGPPVPAIELMGDKIRAKETVRAAGVPVVPGSTGTDLTDAQLIAAARETGTPVLLKPSAGGGGKGMRLVRAESLLGQEITAARREARNSFGDDALLVERWIDRPRHIEIQVLADGHGGVIHLGERECSLQRRHQKVVEEAPSVFLDPVTRRAMGRAAVQAARSCGYVGAGTVEFIVPGAGPSPHTAGDAPAPYYFMEMNTRLQVEHPVTELITGLDLVEWQLRIASGERLPFGQDDITFAGHAIEARICAEMPARGFLPSAGTVLALREPHGDGIRVDSGLSVGTEVGTSYDPLLAKVIAYGEDRPTALRRLRAALAGTTVLGLDTNTGFLRRLLSHPSVTAGDLDTGLIDRETAALVSSEVPDEVYAAAALLRQSALGPDGSRPKKNPSAGTALHPDAAATPATAAVWVDPFSVPNGWRLGGEPAWTAHWLRVAGSQPVVLQVRGPEEDAEVRIGGEPPIRAALATATEGRIILEWNGVTHTFHRAADWLGRDGDSWRVLDHDPVEAVLRERTGAGGVDTLAAPMPGTVTVVKVAVGDTVAAGESLMVVEAMKMEHVITAPHDGTVAEVSVMPGATVAMDQILAVVDPHEETPVPPVGPDGPDGPGSRDRAESPDSPDRAERGTP